MNKRHYEAVAKVIRRMYEEAERYALDVDHADGVFALQDVVRALADCYEEENPRFDRERFFQAALGHGSDRCNLPERAS